MRLALRLTTNWGHGISGFTAEQYSWLLAQGAKPDKSDILGDMLNTDGAFVEVSTVEDLLRIKELLGYDLVLTSELFRNTLTLEVYNGYRE